MESVQIHMNQRKKEKNGRPQKTIKQTESKTQHGAWC